MSWSPLLGDTMDPEDQDSLLRHQLVLVTVVRAGMGDLQECWGVLRKGFLEEEVCKLSQEVKIRRNRNLRNSKQVSEDLPNSTGHPETQ